MQFVGTIKRISIEKYGRRFVEQDTMLEQIGFGFCWIPFEHFRLVYTQLLGRAKCVRLRSGEAAMNALLCRAIRERRIVRFYYDGGIRDVEPHCHGCSKDNNDLLRGYQIGGYSSSADPVGWKMFRLDRLSGLVVTETAFPGPRPEYDRQDDSMATVYCCL